MKLTHTRAAAGFALLLLLSCSRSDAPQTGQAPSSADGLPPTAKPAVLAELRADLAAERHPSDGGGRAWLVVEEGEDGHAQVGRPGRWTFTFEVGPLEQGVALFDGPSAQDGALLDLDLERCGVIGQLLVLDARGDRGGLDPR